MKAYGPVAAAGAISIGFGLRDRRWDDTETVALLGTLILMIITSFASNTRIAPVVNGIAWLFFIAMASRAVVSISGRGSSNTSARRTSKNVKKEK